MTTRNPDRHDAIGKAWEKKLITVESAAAALDDLAVRCVNHPKVKAQFVHGLQRTPLCEACYDKETHQP